MQAPVPTTVLVGERDPNVVHPVLTAAGVNRLNENEEAMDKIS
jgi:hypothetical protein